jgi:hypothetical protein
MNLASCGNTVEPQAFQKLLDRLFLGHIRSLQTSSRIWELSQDQKAIAGMFVCHYVMQQLDHWQWQA